jgi:release factor glutamine methyltransferase
MRLWWLARTAVAGLRFDLALANPPYIAGTDPHLAALTHEPLPALTPGGDGMAALHEIIDSAPAHLRPGAWLLLEHGWDQAALVAARLQARGFTPIQTRRDLGGQARCTGGQWPTTRLEQR